MKSLSKRQKSKQKKIRHHVAKFYICRLVYSECRDALAHYFLVKFINALYYKSSILSHIIMNPLALVIVALLFYSTYSHSHHKRQENEPTSNKKLRETMVEHSTRSTLQNGPKMGPKIPDMTKVPKSPEVPPPKSQTPAGKGKTSPPESQPPAGKDSGKGKAYALEDYQYIKKSDLKKSKKDGKYDIPEEQDIPVLPPPNSNDSDIKEKIDEDQTEGAIEDNDAIDSNNDNGVTGSEGESSVN